MAGRNARSGAVVPVSLLYGLGGRRWKKTGPFEKLRQAIENSDAYQDRLKDVRTESDFLSALEDIATAEGIALQRAEIERQIQATRSRMAELSEDELASVSGGYNYTGLDAWFDSLSRHPIFGARLNPL